MPEAVLEKAENAIVHLLLDPGGKQHPEPAVDGGARLVGAVEQERQIEHAEFRDSIGQVAARLIAEREETVFHEPQNVFGPVAEVHDIPDISDLDAIVELRREPLADALEGPAETRRRRSIAAHANLNRIG